MASTIDDTSIDATFPVAGQDTIAKDLEIILTQLNQTLLRLNQKLQHYKQIQQN